MYIVTRIDDYGRDVENMLLVNADSKQEARAKASIALNIPEISTTGFFSAEKINITEIEARRYKLNSQLEFYSRVI